MNIGDNTVSKYMSLVKIHHTVFSLPFALIGFFLGLKTSGSSFNLQSLLIVILCVLFARNAAMGFNRYVDRNIDKKNPRTALREIPREAIQPRSALFFVIVNAILFMVSSGFLNMLCLALSPVALLVVMGYSFTKRFTSLSHLFLGMGLALAPIGAYLAVAARFDIVPLIYSFCVLFWVSGFDIIYALQDIEFDRSENLRSIPVRLGGKGSLWLSAMLHVVSVALIVAAGFIYPFNMLYWIGAIVFSMLIIYQHLIVKPKDLSRVNLAFFTMNGIASIIYAVFVIADLYIRI